MSGFHTLVLVGAGLVAGIVGTAGGITTLVSYPALLAVGVPALAANVANIVALVACWPGSAVASRPELAGRGLWVVRWVTLTAAGGALGAGLLLTTPGHVFDGIVPFLVAGGSLTLLFQPRLTAWHARRFARLPPALLPAGLIVVSVYNGYFGAGAGVMTLALLLFAVDAHLPTANALKNMLVGAATLASAVTYVAAGPVDWRAVAPLAGGMLCGAMIGPLVARRAPTDLLRWLVAMVGLGLAVELWVTG